MKAEVTITKHASMPTYYVVELNKRVVGGIDTGRGDMMFFNYGFGTGEHQSAVIAATAEFIALALITRRLTR